MEEVRGSVPEEESGYAAVGPCGAGFQAACSEEGSDEPGPEGFLPSEGGWSWVLEFSAMGFVLPEGLSEILHFHLSQDAELIGAGGNPVCGLVE